MGEKTRGVLLEKQGVKELQTSLAPASDMPPFRCRRTGEEDATSCSACRTTFR
jgi:hypothetical protein